MRQTHVGGDKLFVGYAGDTVPVVVDRVTGETRQAQIFVAVMGASNFTYVEMTWTQTLGDWIGADTRQYSACEIESESRLMPAAGAPRQQHHSRLDARWRDFSH